MFNIYFILLFFASYSLLEAVPLNFSSEQLIPIQTKGSETPEDVFVRLDRDENDEISFFEFIMKDEQYINKKLKEYSEADINGDDTVDFEEFLQMYKAEFKNVPTETQKDHPLARTSTGIENDDEYEAPRKEDITQLEDQIETNLLKNRYLDSSRKVSEQTYLKQASREAFEIYDEDLDGLLDENELTFMIQDYLECALLTDPENIIGRYDINEDGGLDRKEMWTLENEMPRDQIEPLFTFEDEVDDAEKWDSSDELDLDSSEDRLVVFKKYNRGRSDEFIVALDD